MKTKITTYRGEEIEHDSKVGPFRVKINGKNLGVRSFGLICCDCKLHHDVFIHKDSIFGGRIILDFRRNEKTTIILRNGKERIKEKGL